MLIIIPLQGRRWRNGGCFSHLEGLNIVNIPTNLGGIWLSIWEMLYGHSDLWKDEGFLKQSLSGDSCERGLLREHCQWRGSEGSNTGQEERLSKGVVLAGGWLLLFLRGALACQSEPHQSWSHCGQGVWPSVIPRDGPLLVFFMSVIFWSRKLSCVWSVTLIYKTGRGPSKDTSLGKDSSESLVANITELEAGFQISD